MTSRTQGLLLPEVHPTMRQSSCRCSLLPLPPSDLTADFAPNYRGTPSLKAFTKRGAQSVSRT